MSNFLTEIRAMDPPRYTLAEAAEKVGRSPDTIARWRKQGLCTPSEQKVYGKVTVPLYTDDDITVLKALADVQRPGRKTDEAVKRLNSAVASAYKEQGRRKPKSSKTVKSAKK